MVSVSKTVGAVEELKWRMSNAYNSVGVRGD